MNAAPGPTVCTVTPLRDLPHLLNLPTGNPYPMDSDDYNRKDAVGRGVKALEDIPRRYRHAVASDPGVTDYVRQLVAIADETPGRQHGGRADISTGPSLLLVGPTGTGKTFQAFGIIRALAVSGASGCWRAVTAADLYAEMRPRHHVDSEEVFDRYARIPLLLLDDLGAAKASEWTEEITYRIITRRYNEERPTIITSNLAPRQLEEELGGRVYSRLHEMASMVVLDGKNLRADQ